MTAFSEGIVFTVLAHTDNDHNDCNQLVVRAFAESAAISAAAVLLEVTEVTV